MFRVTSGELQKKVLFFLLATEQLCPLYCCSYRGQVVHRRAEGSRRNVRKRRHLQRPGSAAAVPSERWFPSLFFSPMLLFPPLDLQPAALLNLRSPSVLFSTLSLPYPLLLLPIRLWPSGKVAIPSVVVLPGAANWDSPKLFFPSV